MKTFTLSNDVKMPCPGFGTSPLKGDVAYEAVQKALKFGYRHIDTAAIYKNEEAVGKAIADSPIDRKEVFITSKLDPTIKTYEGALNAFRKTIKALDVTYLDLYLIHAPWPWDDVGSDYEKGNIEAYKALEKLYKEKKVRAIGVSNFAPEHLDNIITNTSIVPHVNQIKYHVGLKQKEIVRYCDAKNILIEAYSPLGRGDLLNNTAVKKIAHEKNVSSAQVLLKYIIDNNIVPLPRSKNPSNIENNLKLNFTLDKSNIIILDAIELKK